MPFPQPKSARAQRQLTYLRRFDICMSIHEGLRTGDKSNGFLVGEIFSRLANDYDVSPGTIYDIHRDHCLKRGTLKLPRWITP